MFNESLPDCVYNRVHPPGVKPCARSKVFERGLMTAELLWPGRSVRFVPALTYSIYNATETSSVMGQLNHKISDSSVMWFAQLPSRNRLVPGMVGPAFTYSAGVLYSRTLGAAFEVPSDALLGPQVLVLHAAALLLWMASWLHGKAARQWSLPEDGKEAQKVIGVLGHIVLSIYGGHLTLVFLAEPIRPVLNSRAKFLAYLEDHPEVGVSYGSKLFYQRTTQESGFTSYSIAQRFKRTLAHRRPQFFTDRWGTERLSMPDKEILILSFEAFEGLLTSGHRFPFCDTQRQFFPDIPSNFGVAYTSVPKNETPYLDAARRKLYTRFLLRQDRLYQPMCPPLPGSVVETMRFPVAAPFLLLFLGLMLSTSVGLAVELALHHTPKDSPALMALAKLKV